MYRVFLIPSKISASIDTTLTGLEKYRQSIDSVLHSFTGSYRFIPAGSYRFIPVHTGSYRFIPVHAIVVDTTHNLNRRFVESLYRRFVVLLYRRVVVLLKMNKAPVNKTEMRKVMEIWFGKEPNRHWLTEKFPTHTQVAKHGDPRDNLKCFVWINLPEEEIAQFDSTEDEKFNTFINDLTHKIRKKIVRPAARRDPGYGSIVPPEQRQVGDMNSSTAMDRRFERDNNPDKMIKHKKRIKLAGRNYWLKKREDKILTEKQYKFDDHFTMGMLVDWVMNESRPELGNLSVIDYARDVGAVYIFFTTVDNFYEVELESTRFLTDGQKRIGNGNHNAVLMRRNPNVICPRFTNNYCPYEQRMDYNFLRLSEEDCDNLGIEYFPIVQGYMTAYEGRLIEKLCQDVLHPLELGHQRLHRVCGAGTGSLDNTKDVLLTVGVTYLPEGFFEKNMDIVIVGSAYDTDGYN